MRRVWWLVPVVFGCEGDDGTPTDGDPPVTPPPADCTLQKGNGVRAVCHVARETAGPVEVAITIEGQTRVFSGDPEVAAQDVTVWDLAPNVAFDWEIRDGGTVLSSGTTMAGIVPEKGRVHFDVQVPGTPSATRMLVPIVCGGLGPSLVVLDDQGRVRWFEAPPNGPFPVAFGHTDSGLFTVASGRQQLYAWKADGTLVHDLALGIGLERPVHHALVGEGEDILVLDATAVPLTDGLTYVDEGVTRIAPDGTTSRDWDFFSVFDPTGLGQPFGPIGFGYWTLTFDDAIDYAHVNGVALADGGDWLVSIKNLDTVIRLDPLGPTVEWALLGSNRSIAFGDVALDTLGEGVVGFEAPHTPRLAPWGSVLLMDNGLLLQPSRVLELSVDAPALSVELVRSWELPAVCPVHSSVWGLPNGNVLAACAATGQVFELDDTGIVFQARVSCDGEGQGLLLGAQPITY
jgi:hypothetical protein